MELVTTFLMCCQDPKGKEEPHEHPKKITETGLIKIRLTRTGNYCKLDRKVRKTRQLV